MKQGYKITGDKINALGKWDEFPVNNIPLLFNQKKVNYSVTRSNKNTINYIDALEIFVTDNREKMWLQNKSELKSITPGYKEIFNDTGLHIIKHVYDQTLPGKINYWKKIAELI